MSTHSAFINTPDADGGLDISPVGGRIGAEVLGVRLGGDLGPDRLAALRQALFRHKVLFFRGQQHLDDAAQQAFGRAFGEPVAHPTVPARGEFLHELDSHAGQRANRWHTDLTFLPAFAYASILRAVVIPPAGGDTVWANTAAAYADLPQPLRALADSLRAIHSNDFDYAAHNPHASELQRHRFNNVFATTVYETEHPVVRVHPGSGERNLVLGGFIKRFVDIPADHTQALFNLLQSYVTRLENTVRWRWQEGDVAIWDNRATQHLALDDYGDQRRIVRRVTLAGDVPVGLDGRPSRALQPVAEPVLDAAE